MCAGVHRWGRRPLSERQISYAALDALASMLIYDCIEACIGSDLETQIRHGLQSSDAGQGAQGRKGTRMLPASTIDQQLTQHQSGAQTPQRRESASPDSACLEHRKGAGNATLDCTPVIDGLTVINSFSQSAAQQEALIKEGSASCQNQSSRSSTAEPMKSGRCCSSGPSGSVFLAGAVHTRLPHAQQSPQLRRRACIQLPEKQRPPYSPPLLRSQQ